MNNMKNPLFLVFTIFLFLLISSTVTSVSATKGWIKSYNGPFVPHTASYPGSIKICGGHKCGPFEDAKKSLQDKLKQNKSIHVLVANKTNPLFEKNSK